MNKKIVGFEMSDCARRNQKFKFVNYPGVSRYMVSNYGVVMRFDKRTSRWEFVNQHIVGGYARVRLSTDSGREFTEAVHRLVAEAFIEKPQIDEKLEVNHKDFNRINNKADNLEWVTHKQNMDHYFENKFYRKE